MLLIGDELWLWPAAAILAAALLVLWLSYRGVRGERRVRLVCGLLKATGFVLLATFLFEPLWSGVRARPGANVFVVLADNSRSLEIREVDATDSRGEALKSLLEDGGSTWQARLEQDFDVRRYQFADNLTSIDDFAQLDFTGTASHLHSTLATAAERFSGRPVAGVLLFTDGNATDARSLNVAGLPPVFPVPIGTERAQPDLGIAHVAVNQTAFEDAPVTIQADVSASGLAGRQITARVLDEQDQPLAELTQTVPADSSEAPLTFRFQLRPPETGVSFYTVNVTADATDVEATLENNRRMIQIDRGAGRKRVLYVSGRPNWEFKFLRRALEDDPAIELAALLRIAKREAKFDFRGRAGESSNPLFRGFKQDADADTESYDEPVIVRLNMRDADELRGGFPKSDEELFAFHAVILDDLEGAFFTQDQLELLERFVSERGGGLLMLGGQESFADGDYEHTPVARLLPIYVDRAARGTEFHSVRNSGDMAALPKGRKLGRSETPSYGDVSGGSYRMLLTREGWLQPWMRLRSNETDERQRLEAMPEFKTLNRTSSIKPGAAVLAEAIDATGHRHPALAAQRYGHGRAAALMIGDLWRWRLRQSGEHDDHGQAWRQAVRWLVADVPEPVTIAVHETDAATPGAVRLRVQALDAEFQPMDNAAVELSVQPPDGEAVTLHAEPSLEEPGVFGAAYVARHAGPYRVVATVTDEDGQASGTAETGWVSDPAADEFRTVGVNREVLQKLADATGGEVIEPGELEEFAASLPARDVPITERWTYPFWHQTWVFTLVIVCFVGEWGLRRAKGLP